MMTRFTCVFAALIFASGLSSLDAQATQPSRGELFIQTFGPQSNSTSLRASILEQQEQVRLAFYGIDSTLAQMKRGTLDEETGNRSIDGYSQTIRNYAHDNANEALVLANQGRISDVAEIRNPLAALLTIARQDSLRGHEALAKEAQGQMLKTLTGFSQAFSKTCYDQPLDPEFVRDLQNQNDRFATGIDVTPCAKCRRSFRPKPGLDDPLPGTFAWGWKFEQKGCSLDGKGEWKLTVENEFQSGSAEFDLELNQDRTRAEGEFDITLQSLQGARAISEFHCKVEFFVREAKRNNGKVKRQEWAKVTKSKEVLFDSDHQPFEKQWPHLYDELSGEFPVKLSYKPCRE